MSSRPKTAKVMRIHPEGATLARATGAPVVVGDVLSDGETVTLATPTGSGGALTLDASLSVTVRMVRAPAPAINVVLASSGGPATVAEIEAARSSLLSIGAAQAEPDVKPIVAPIFESGLRSATGGAADLPHIGSIGVRRIGESDEGLPK